MHQTQLKSPVANEIQKEMLTSQPNMPLQGVDSGNLLNETCLLLAKTNIEDAKKVKD